MLLKGTNTPSNKVTTNPWTRKDPGTISSSLSNLEKEHTTGTCRASSSCTSNSPPHSHFVINHLLLPTTNGNNIHLHTHPTPRHTATVAIAAGPHHPRTRSCAALSRHWAVAAPSLHRFCTRSSTSAASRRCASTRRHTCDTGTGTGTNAHACSGDKTVSAHL